jgi:hypothetical protein
MPPSIGLLTVGDESGTEVCPEAVLLGPLFGVYTFLPELKSYLSNPGVIGSYIYTLGGRAAGVAELVGVDGDCVTVDGAVAVLATSACRCAASAALFTLPPVTLGITDAGAAAVALACLIIASL